MLGGAEKVPGGAHRPGEPLRAKIVPPALQQHCGKWGAHQLLDDGNVLGDELFLQVDGMGGNHRLPLLAGGGQDRGQQVGQRLTHPCPGLDDHRPFFLQSLPHLHGHPLLLGAVFKVRRFRQQSLRGERLVHFLRQSGQGVRRRRAEVRPASGHVLHQFLRQPAFHPGRNTRQGCSQSLASPGTNCLRFDFTSHSAARQGKDPRQNAAWMCFRPR